MLLSICSFFAFFFVLAHAQLQPHVRLVRSTGSPFPTVHVVPRPPPIASLAANSQAEANRTQSLATVQKSNMDQLLHSLLNGYDKNERPQAANSTVGPVLVKVNIMIRMLSKIDVVNMEYGMQITLRETWLDRRLAYDKYNLTYKPNFLTVPFLASQIWMPDSFFPNEKAGHRHLIDTENMFIRIFPDGKVLYSVRLSLTCSCPMYLALYPLDVQHCDFDLISYAFTTDDIVYEWDSVDPVQKKPGVGGDLPNFRLDDHVDTTISCTSKTNTGAYACLRMRLRLSRMFNYFLLQLYFPTTMIVAVSWENSQKPNDTEKADGVRRSQKRPTKSDDHKLVDFPVPHEDSRLPCTCQNNNNLGGITATTGPIAATLGMINPALSAFLPLTAGLATGGLAEQLQWDRPDGCPHRPWSLEANRAPKRTLWQAFKHKLRKPDKLHARIDFYARIYAPVGFLIFNCIYWSLCLYKSRTWEHPTS
ncbi:Glutamate-gated chloride channel subunit beta [Aphelenchoides fujianensis]|nr:Glutamate-gated chloride channel subunit beta [Aphelenchoides fujianensis]